MTQAGRKKRAVASCIPCYTRKQKCNRQYPCDRCSRRQRPELCSYSTFQTQARGATKGCVGTKAQSESSSSERNSRAGSWNYTSNSVIEPELSPDPPSLVHAFGYYGESEHNTMGLLRNLIPDDDGMPTEEPPLSNEISTKVSELLDKMIDRLIVDHFIRYFIAEVNWIDRVLYPPWFLSQYQKWWTQGPPTSVAHIDFAILILRICSYASEFLSGPAYPDESINGVPLADIRKSCDDISNALAPICVQCGPKGSLVRAMHISLGGLAHMARGQLNEFWRTLSCATRVAQQIGMHVDSKNWSDAPDELEKDMRRRMFCNLYIWDSCLSKRLDRIPFLSDKLRDDVIPQMHLPLSNDLGPDAPDYFTGRMLEARLTQFWRRHCPGGTYDYDPLAAEQRYDDFCNTFLPTIPPIFSLLPDKQFDERLPTLPMQRHLLHKSIFGYLCWNFRRSLVQKPEKVNEFPEYKRMLVSHNKKALAVAALKILGCAMTLQGMMGASHARFGAIIVSIFDAAVLLLSLCVDESFPGESEAEGTRKIATDPLGAGMIGLTKAKCMQAAKGAFVSLQGVVEGSKIADVSARALGRLIHKIDNPPPAREREDSAVRPEATTLARPLQYDQTSGPTTIDAEFDIPFGNTEDIEIIPNWDEVLQDLTGKFGTSETDWFLGTGEL